jgi:hypothetical protein
VEGIIRTSLTYKPKIRKLFARRVFLVSLRAPSSSDEIILSGTHFDTLGFTRNDTNSGLERNFLQVTRFIYQNVSLLFFNCSCQSTAILICISILNTFVSGLHREMIDDGHKNLSTFAMWATFSVTLDRWFRRKERI